MKTALLKPSVHFLYELINEVLKGRIRIPVLQRSFVWRRDQILDLLDSVKKQYPIGSLFFWKTNNQRTSRERIGPIPIPEAGYDVVLVLDGQQRLTALVGTLLAHLESAEIPPGDPQGWRVFYDTKNDNFFHRSPDDAEQDHHVPVAGLLDGIVTFHTLSKILNSEVLSITEKQVCAQNLQVLARAFQSYRIPVIEFGSPDEDPDEELRIAVDSFARLNTKGQNLSPDVMISALTYRQGGFHLGEAIDGIMQELERSTFGHLDRKFVLRAVLAAADADIYRTDWTRLGKKTTQNIADQIPKAVTKARDGLMRTFTFLQGIGVPNIRFLPYGMQVVALSSFLGQRANPNPSDKKKLAQFFWITSFTGWFGLGNSNSDSRLIKNLVAIGRGKRSFADLEFDWRRPALSFPSRFNLRSARVRALLAMFVEWAPKDKDGGPLPIAEQFLRQGPSTIGRICKTVNNKELKASPANRIFSGQDSYKQAKGWLLDVQDPEIWRSHGITPEAMEHLRAGRNDKFLEVRLRSLIELEEKFMIDRGVTLPRSRTPVPSPIDTVGT